MLAVPTSPNDTNALRDDAEIGEIGGDESIPRLSDCSRMKPRTFKHSRLDMTHERDWANPIGISTSALWRDGEQGNLDGGGRDVLGL